MGMGEKVRSGANATIDITVRPGDHTLRSLLIFQGNGAGISAYLKGYRFEIRSSRSFTAAGNMEIGITTYEQDPGAPLEERPAVRYREKGSVASAMCSCPCAPAASSSAPPP